MRLRLMTAVLALVFVNAASAASLPCAIAEKEIRKTLTDPLNPAPEDFFACARSRRVCMLSSPAIMAADSIQQLPYEGDATIGLVQSGRTDRPAVCLLGIYSGGSSAAWLFVGWRIESGKPIGISGMERADLHSELEYPRSLANEIYRAYSKYGR